VVASEVLPSGRRPALRKRLGPRFSGAVSPYDTRATLDRLAALVVRLRPGCIVCLGDSFHDNEGFARLAATDRAVLSVLIRQTDWIWVASNHDPAPNGLDHFGGRLVGEARIGALTLRHEPQPAKSGRRSGLSGGISTPKVQSPWRTGS